MTSTTNVTTFIHIIVLLHAFSNICHFIFITSHMSLLYTTVISVCFLYYKENPPYHSSSCSSDPAGRSTSSVSSSLSSCSEPLTLSYLLPTLTLSKTTTCTPLILPHIQLLPHCHSPSPERPPPIETPAPGRGSRGGATGHAWWHRPAWTTVILPQSCFQPAPLARTVCTPPPSSDPESPLPSRTSSILAQTPFPYRFDLPLPWRKY